MTTPPHSWPELWKDLKIVALDVETTGFEPDTERIIEIGLVTFENGEVVDSWGQLINPKKPIPEKVIELTGIKDEDVRDKPLFEEVAHEVFQRLQNVGVCAYNLRFDRSFIAAELERSNLQWPHEAPTFDPLIFARQLQQEHRRHNLGTVAERLGIHLENAHRAVDDAEVAGHILYAFAEQLPKRLKDLLVLQAQWEQLQEQRQAFWRKNRDNSGPSAAMLSANSLGGQAIGLGPAYLYGDELDPLRAIYMSVPEINR